MLYHYLLQIINIVFVSMKIKPLSEKIGFIIEYLIIAFISFIIVLLSMLYGYIEPFTIKCNLDNTIKKIATIIFRYIFKIGYYYKHFITNNYNIFLLLSVFEIIAYNINWIFFISFNLGIVSVFLFAIAVGFGLFLVGL